MNVLSLDAQHVVVQEIKVPLITDLEKNGFTPISGALAGTAGAWAVASTV